MNIRTMINIAIGRMKDIDCFVTFFISLNLFYLYNNIKEFCFAVFIRGNYSVTI